jgi:hypothetical protein
MHVLMQQKAVIARDNKLEVDPGAVEFQSTYCVELFGVEVVD